MPGRFEIVARRRPVALVAPAFVQVREEGPGSWPLPQPAPYAAATAAGGRELSFTTGDAELAVELDGDAIGLRVTNGGVTTRHRSRRFGRLPAVPEAIGLTLTGTQLTAFAKEAGRWVARARHDLLERLDTRDERLTADLHVGNTGGTVEAGAFGQLGLRDVRLVTHADGTPVRDGSKLLLSATHAGPGFFDAAHTGVWALDPEGWLLEHRADLFFRRPDRSGVYGDHATHLVRHGTRWLVATSTWGDFEKAHRDATVSATLAESDADLTHGRHVLDTRALALPTTGLRSVGTWDPHLVSTGDDGWLVAYVSATRFFRFHPVLAAGPDLDRLELVAADLSRTATEGPTLMRLDGEWRLLASDGRRGPRDKRAAFPVFDRGLAQVGELDAPYPTNIPWPTLVETADGWALLMFDGTRVGGELVGYGTHGDLVVATASR
ncbi:MAG: hypothetical protein ABIO16_03500 [Nocardioides sp.]